MNRTRVKVGGQTYLVACDPGDEARVEALARAVDERLERLGGARAPTAAQNLLLAALMLADELEEARNAAPPPPAESTLPADPSDPALPQALEGFADRLEALADAIEARG